MVQCVAEAVRMGCRNACYARGDAHRMMTFVDPTSGVQGGRSDDAAGRLCRAWKPCTVTDAQRMERSGGRQRSRGAWPHGLTARTAQARHRRGRGIGAPSHSPARPQAEMVRLFGEGGEADEPLQFNDMEIVQEQEKEVYKEDTPNPGRPASSDGAGGATGWNLAALGSGGGRAQLLKGAFYPLRLFQVASTAVAQR